MGKSWRDRARPIIHRVLEENKGKDPKEIRKALREAYPWHERSMHPYKIWLDEIKVQTGQRNFGHHPDKQNPDQTSLF
jgi:hypothetical protein